MKCAQIYLCEFSEGNDSQQEIIDNIASLWKRYSARHPDPVKYLAHLKPDVNADHKKQSFTVKTSLGNESDGADALSGVYLMCHGGESNTTPHVSELATRVVNYFVVRRGIPLRKLSLAACKAGGRSTTKTGLKASPVVDFCTLLLEHLRSHGALTRLDGLMVYGFNTLVTTYDPDAPFIKKKKRGGSDDPTVAETHVVADPRLANRIGTATFKSGLDYKPTHPKDHFPATEAAIKTLRAQHAQALWEGPSKNKVRNWATANGIKNAANLGWDALSDDQRDKIIVQHGKQIYEPVIAELNRQNSVTAPLWQELRAYAQMKIVRKLVNERFVVAPLSEFTQNADLARDLKFVEESLGPDAPRLLLKDCPIA